MRTVGPPGDSSFGQAAEICNATTQDAFTFGRCPNVISCVLQNIDPAYAAGMSAGSNIASLIPTTLALIGSPPLELVQLALVSPPRAIATCCFSIGLPSGLFRQLRPVMHRLSDRVETSPKMREWSFDVPVGSTKAGWRLWLLKFAVVDSVTLALAAVMIWFNWRISSSTMVVWRCEYGWLLFAWPMACIMWLLISMLLLYVLIETVDIRYSSMPNQSHRSLAHLLFLPYRVRRGSPHGQSIQQGQVREKTAVSTAAQEPFLSTNGLERVTVRLTAYSAHGPRSWSWYEATLETLAVGIYLYATFVLTSTIFLTSEEAILYAVCLTLSLSGIRIIGSLA